MEKAINFLKTSKPQKTLFTIVLQIVLNIIIFLVIIFGIILILYYFNYIDISYLDKFYAMIINFVS